MGYKGFASLQVRPQQVRPYYDQLSPSPLCLSYPCGFLLITSVSFQLKSYHSSFSAWNKCRSHFSTTQNWVFLLQNQWKTKNSFFYVGPIYRWTCSCSNHITQHSFRTTRNKTSYRSRKKTVEGLLFEDNQPIVFPFVGLKHFLKDEKVNYCNFFHCINNFDTCPFPQEIINSL